MSICARTCACVHVCVCMCVCVENSSMTATDVCKPYVGVIDPNKGEI